MTRATPESIFGDFAFYCDPSSVESILSAVNKAAGANGEKGMQEKIFSQYTWSNTAEETLQAYNEVLGRKTHD